MNHIQAFEAQLKDIRNKNGSRGDTLTLERTYFNEKIMPAIIADGRSRGLSEGVINANVAKGQARFRDHITPLLENYNFIEKDGGSRSQTALAKERRTDRAIDESSRTGSKVPLIKETAISSAETVGNAFGQGSGRMLEGLARFANDIGENEKGTTLDKVANFGDTAAKYYESNASDIQRKAQSGELGIGAKLGVGAVQSAPMMALPFGAAKTGATVLGKFGLSAQAAARGGLLTGLAAGHTQNYGEVRRGSIDNLQRDFPTWESLQGNPDFEKNMEVALNSGASLEQARAEAYNKTLDDISEKYADIYGTAMTALDVVLPSEAAFAVAKKLPIGKTKLGQAVTATDVSKELVSRELSQAVPYVGLSRLLPDVSLAANKASLSVLAKEATQEGLQGGVGELGSQKASADIGGKAVDYGQIARQALEEGVAGGIMGGGLRFATASPTSQAKAIANDIRNKATNFYQEEAQARQELASAIESGDQNLISQAQDYLHDVQSRSANIKALYDNYGIDAPEIIGSLSANTQQNMDNNIQYSNELEPSFVGGQQEQPINNVQQSFNDSNIPSPVVDYKQVSPFSEATPPPIIDHNKLDIVGSSQEKPTISNIVARHRFAQQDRVLGDILSDIDNNNLDLAQQKIVDAQSKGIDVNHAVMRLNEQQAGRRWMDGVGLSEYYKNRGDNAVQDDAVPVKSNLGHNQPQEELDINQEEAVENNTAAMPIFAEQIADAHINNPQLKPKLIQDEVSKSGRPRHEVLKEVSQIVNELDSHVGEPQGEIFVNPENTSTPTEHVESNLDVMQDGDIGRIKDGQPFLNERAANTHLKKLGLAETHEVARLGKASKFILRPKQQLQQESGLDAEALYQGLKSEFGRARTLQEDDGLIQIKASNGKVYDVRLNEGSIDIIGDNLNQSIEITDSEPTIQKVADILSNQSILTTNAKDTKPTKKNAKPAKNVLGVEIGDKITIPEIEDVYGNKTPPTIYTVDGTTGDDLSLLLDNGARTVESAKLLKQRYGNKLIIIKAKDIKAESINKDDSSTPQDEIKALEVFNSLGKEAIEQRLNVLESTLSDRRNQQMMLDNSPDSRGYASIDYATEVEREEIHLLKTALMIGVDTQGEAQQRVQERLAKRQKPTKQVDASAHEAATSPLNNIAEPTEAQIEAGNYKKGHIQLHGLDISIENPKGSIRSGKRPDGTQWEHTMSDHYGYIKQTKGADDEHIDTYIGSNPDSDQVFIIDQLDQETGGFDEHKVMLGFNSQEEATTAYKSNFDDGWKVGPLNTMNMEQFKDWLKNEDTSKPVSNDEEIGKTHKKSQSKAKNTAANSIRGSIAKFEEIYLVNISDEDIAVIVKSLSSKRMLKPIDGTNTLYELLPRTNVEFDARNLVDGRHVVGALAKYDIIKTMPDGWRFELTSQGVDFFYFIGQALSNEGHLLSQSKKSSNTGNIYDLGEKIGGARKDIALSTGSSKKSKSLDDRPTWAKRYTISEIASSTNKNNVGKWVIEDSKKTNWTGGFKQLGVFDTEQQAKDMLPVIVAGLKHRIYARRESEGGFEIWRNINDTKRVKVVNQVFDTKNDAQDYLTKHAIDILETNTTFGELNLPRPEKTDRIGVKRREGDAKDVDFMEVFGFRGVEFGNWNNQVERQQLLNDAYDGLLDLADVLKIPAKAISLNGELALAFGARGKGLSSARAHYEPIKVVINLTKMNGAGSLAHEWWHAFDHYLARQDGMASTEWIVGADGTRSLKIPENDKSYMVSHGFSYRNSMVREDVRNAYTDLMKTMTTKAEQYVEDVQAVDKFVGKSKKEVSSQLDRLRNELLRQLDPKYYKRHNKPASTDQLVEFDTVAQQIIDGEVLETELRTDVKNKATGRGIFSGVRWTNDALEKLGEIYKSVRGRSGFKADHSGVLDRLRSAMNSYSSRLKMLADAQKETTKTKRVPTKFVMYAKELDDGRGSNYWTTPHELSARAFQGFIEDKIAQNNGRSPFLNYAPENVVIETPWGWARPYPRGDERKAINEKFDILVDTLKTEETDTGVRLYSRQDDIKFVQEALNEITEHDELFRYPVSAKNNLPAIFNDLVGNDVQYIGDVTAIDEQQESTADHKYLYRTHGKDFHIYERNSGEVWIDVSRLNEGDGGFGIYAAVGNYAHNTNKSFIGDPAGLSEAAVVRRTNAMLSLALRFGTTDFIEASPEQIKGDPQKGIAPLNWHGNDVEKIRALIDTFLQTTQNQFTGIEKIHYDFRTGQFRDRRGRSVQLDRIKAIDHSANSEAKRSRVGEKTARKIIFLQSLASSESRERSSILEQIIRRGKSLAQSLELIESFSKQDKAAFKTGFTTKQIRKKLVDRFGENIVTKLEQQGILEILDTTPKHIKEQGIEGYYQDGKVTLIADNLTDQTIVPTFLHELGGHAGFQSVLKPSSYNALIESFNTMVKAGNPIALEAKRLAEREAHSGTQQAEYLPYLLTVASKQQLGTNVQRSAMKRFIDRIVSAVKAWVFDKTGINLKLTTSDIAGLSERMIKRIANNPTKLSENNKVLFSRATNKQAVRDAFNMVGKTAIGQSFLLNAERSKLMPKKVTSFFNTMLHKALTDDSGQFKKTFDLVQEKINHVTFDSGASMQVAPDLLTQLEDMSDYTRELKRVGSQLGQSLGLTKSQYLQDIDVISNQIYQDNMSDDPRVRSAVELSRLGFTPSQIELYKQVRDAIDTSLDSFAKTTISKIYLHAGATHDQILELTRKDLPLSKHRDVVIKGINHIASQDSDKTNIVDEAVTNIDNVLEKLGNLKVQGYMPMMRFGKHWMRLIDKSTGKVALRKHFESEAERNRFVENFRKSNPTVPDHEIEVGTVNELQNKVFAGVSPETVALFAKEAGLPTDGIQEEFIKLALRDNHALKRMLKRYKIEGFDNDLKRVLASFVMSNARYGANQLYNGAIDESVLAIEDGQLAEDATRLREYALDPQEEVAGIKNFAFVWYMGASLMFGLVNLTQPIVQTLPYLLQYGKNKSVIFKALSQSLSSMKSGHPIPEKYKKYYEQAKREGHLDPQNTWMLQGLERGKSGIGANAWQLISHASGFFAQASETINRRATLFAALEVAKEMGQAKLEKFGFKDEYDFAIRSIQETQGIYNKGNRPRLSRGNVGSLLMMYKQFMIAYLEQMVRMQRSGLWGGEDDEFKRKMAQLVGFGVSRSVLVMLGILWGFSGTRGLPFARDILDGLETVGGIVGKPFNTEREIQIALRNALGDTVGENTTNILLDGIVNANPIIDVQGRMGMGDLIPASAYFSPTTSEYQKKNELSSLGGAVGGLLEKANNAMEFANVGAYGQAVGQLAPKFLTSGYQGATAAITGDYRNPRTGYKTSDATMFEGLVKMTDAQPARISKEGRIRGMEMRDRAIQQYINSRWKERLEDALGSGDQNKVKALKQEIKEYNASNPRYPITFQQKRAEKMFDKQNQTWQEKRRNTNGLEWMDNFNPYLTPLSDSIN